MAALVRDRVLAQADLRELLQRTGQEHIDPLAELVRRRRALELTRQPSERRFLEQRLAELDIP